MPNKEWTEPRLLIYGAVLGLPGALVGGLAPTMPWLISPSIGLTLGCLSLLLLKPRALLLKVTLFGLAFSLAFPMVLSWIWSWTWLIMITRIPVWSVLAFLLISGGLLFLIASLTRAPEAAPWWTAYRHDTFFGVHWEWGWASYTDAPVSLLARCPRCQMVLEYGSVTKYANRDLHPGSLTNAGTVTLKWERGDWGHLDCDSCKGHYKIEGIRDYHELERLIRKRIDQHLKQQERSRAAN